MVRTVDEAKIVLSADTKKLIAGLNTAQRQIAGFARVALRATLGAAGISAIGAAFDDITQKADNLQNAANKLGLTTEALQELRFAGEEVGVSMNTTDMAIQRFTRRLGEAADGGGELKGILEQYDIAVTDAEGSTRNTVDVLDDLADAVKGASSEQEQLRIAFKAFDSEGAALVTMLRDGSEGLDAMKQKARELGLVIDQETVEELADMNREIELLFDQVQASGTRVFGTLVQGFNDIRIALGQTPETIGQVERRLEALRNQADQLRKLPAGDSFAAGLFGVGDPVKKIQEIEQEISNLAKLRSDLVAAEKAASDRSTGDLNTKAAEDRAKKVNSILASVESRTQGVISSILELQGVSASEIEMSMQAYQIENQLKREGIELNARERAELTKALDLMGEKIDKQKELEDATQQTSQAAQEWTNALNQGLADAIFQARSFGDILDALLKRLLNSALFGLDGQGGLLGGITNSLGGAIGGLFGRATGGYMNPGVPYFVGEKGFGEVAVAGSGGRVVPAGRTRTMQGGGVNLDIHYHFDGTYHPSHRAMVQNAIEETQPATVAAVVDGLNRGF